MIEEKAKIQSMQFAQLLVRQEMNMLCQLLIKRRKLHLLKQCYLTWRHTYLESVHCRTIQEENMHRQRQARTASNFHRRNTIAVYFYAWREVFANIHQIYAKAAIKIQSLYRGFKLRKYWKNGGKKELKMMHVAIAFCNAKQKKLAISDWRNTTISLLKWRKKISRRITTWGKSTLHLNLKHAFPAKSWFSREGKTVMAMEYYKYRLRNVCWCKWLYFMMRMDSKKYKISLAWKYRNYLIDQR
jgi:hypothetical protein